MASRTAYSTWTPQKPTLFDGHYLRNRSTFDIGVLVYIGIVQHKEHSLEVLSIPPGTPCIYIYIKRERERQLSLCIDHHLVFIYFISSSLFTSSRTSIGKCYVSQNLLF